MKNYFSLFLIVFTFSCKNKNENTIIERNIEIEKIFESIITQESLNNLKNASAAIPTSEELKKLKVHILASNIEKIPPKPIDGIYINDLFYYNLDVIFISKKDSLDLMNQNLILKSYRINNSFSKKLKLTTFKEQKILSKNNRDTDFLQLSIPIFSSDNNKAYVEINEICFGNCGWGKAIYLEKRNGKWTIVYKHQLWVG